MWRALTVFAFGLSALTTARAEQIPIPISSCGQTVPPRGMGVVTNDITCPSSDPFVVSVEDRGKLDLAGFTLSGAVRGVKCVAKCIISSTAGPGMIRDAATGIQAPRLARLSNLAFENNGVALLGDFQETTLRGDQITITGGFGMQAKIARFTNLTVTGAYPAIQAKRTVLNGCQITGCGGSAIRGLIARLSNCTLSGNDPVDLETDLRPRLTNTSCERSWDLGHQTWGVCTND